MSTLSELIHYCNEPDPIGALMLTGEWGCGKTYLINHELADALKDTHVIVRVSLFGISSPDKLKETIRQKWFEACLPILGSMKKVGKMTGGFINSFSRAIRTVNPLVSSAAAAMVAVNDLDFVPIKSEVEDLNSHTLKRVILVFDDLERVKMDPLELLGVINNYCENQKFNTIILTSEDAFKKERETDAVSYHMLREKTVSQYIYHIPDYASIISSIISKRKWPTAEYAEYLKEHEDTVVDVFMSDEKETTNVMTLRENGKYHNFRTLTKGLDSFYRIYYHFENAGIEASDDNLYSFLAYFLAMKSGIRKNGEVILESDDSDIKQLYPRYSPDTMTETERAWIKAGIWCKEKYLEEMRTEDSGHTPDAP